MNTGRDGLVECATTPNTLSTCTVVSLTGSTIHYIDQPTGRLITCTSTECKLNRSTLKGYFGSSMGNTGYDVISCDGTECKELTNASIDTCSKIGGIKFSSPNIIFCISATNEDTQQRVTEASTDAIYLSVTPTAKDDFPGVEANTQINVKIKNKNSVILMEEDELPPCLETILTSAVCATGHTHGQYCYHATSKKIYQTEITSPTEVKCTMVSVTGDTSQMLFFDAQAKIIEELSEGHSDAVAYQCSSTACEVFKGYTVVGSNAIHCNGWKDEGCEVSLLSDTDMSRNCAGGNEIGRFYGSGGEICFGSAGIPLPTKDTVKTIAFKAGDANEFYGKGKGELVFLSISSTSIQVISKPKPSSDKYYYNQLKTAKSDCIIKCNSSGCTLYDGYTDENGAAGLALLDDGDQSKKTLIYLLHPGTGSYNDISDDLESGNKYYILFTDKSKILVCTKENGCNPENGSKVDGHFYIDGTANPSTYAISCKNNDCASSAVQSGEHYIDGKENTKVIVVDVASSSSIPGSTSNGHAYVLSSDDTKKTIITCSSGKGCTTTLLQDIPEGGKFFISGDDIKHLIKCTSAEGCVAEADARTSGTEVDGTNDERIIICNTDGCISSSGNN